MKKDTKINKVYWFSHESLNEYEIYKREERLRNKESSECYHSLADYKPYYFDKKKVKITGSRIESVGSKEWVHCLLGNPLRKGIHRISLVACGSFFVGLVDSSQKLSSDGKSVYENQIGLFYFCIYINIVIIIMSIGVGIDYSLYLYTF